MSCTKDATEAIVRTFTEGPFRELVIREGKAIELKEPVKVNIEGVLDTPAVWLEKRVDQIDQKKCFITVDREKLEIVLVVDEKDFYQAKIKGSLDFHPAFKKFGINDGEYLTTFEMADLIKMNRSFFENRDEAMRLNSILRNFKGKIDKEVEASDDNRGNRTALIAQKVESNIPSGFSMILPVFKGQEKEKLEVEVYIRPSDMACTLISPQANEITEFLRDAAFNKVMDSIKSIAPDIVIIEK